MNVPIQTRTDGTAANPGCDHALAVARHGGRVFPLNGKKPAVAHPVLLGIEMSLVSAPTIRVITGDTKRLQQRFELEENLVFAPSKHICQYLSRVVINGMPQPSRIRFLPTYAESRRGLPRVVLGMARRRGQG